MKKWLVGFIAALLVSAFCLPALYAVDAPADLVIKAPEGMAATQEPVKFSHKGHAAIDCKACHHKWDGKAAITKCASAGCHDATDPKDKTSDKSFYRAYHDMKSEKSCLGCHKAKQKGPTKCTDCHPKKS
jgi:hypothetical protein